MIARDDEHERDFHTYNDAQVVAGGAAVAVAADYLVSEPAPRVAVMRAPMGPVTSQQALAIASDIGVVTVQNPHFDSDQWEIEGRDNYGKWIDVDRSIL